MISFKTNQRVKVRQTDSGIMLNALGTVTRVCSDGRAWIDLDVRSKVEAAHPFDDAARANKVRALPEDCEVDTKTRRGRREAVKEAARVEPGSIEMAAFGRDHWSTFAYIETRCVDFKGYVANQHMRCRADRVLLAHLGTTDALPPTRLSDGRELAEYDDWDCVVDLEAVGLIESIGTTIHPAYAMTALGHEMASRIREHKSRGGSISTFVPQATQQEGS